MDPANCSEVYCALASLEDFKGILGVLELSGVDAPAAPGRGRRYSVGLFGGGLRHVGGLGISDLLCERVDEDLSSKVDASH